MTTIVKAWARFGFEGHNSLGLRRFPLSSSVFSALLSDLSAALTTAAAAASLSFDAAPPCPSLVKRSNFARRKFSLDVFSRKVRVAASTVAAPSFRAVAVPLRRHTSKMDARAG